jgi:hypothetical protein
MYHLLSARRTWEYSVCLASRKMEHVLIVFLSVVSSAKAKFLSLVILENQSSCPIHNCLVIVKSLLAKEVL